MALDFLLRIRLGIAEAFVGDRRIIWSDDRLPQCFELRCEK